jgi:hypothetical protein
MTDNLSPEKCINYIHQEALSAIYSGVFSPFDTISKKQLEFLKIQAINSVTNKKALLSNLKEQVSLATTKLANQTGEYHKEILKNFDVFNEKMKKAEQENQDKTEEELKVILDSICQENKKTTDSAYAWHIKGRDEILTTIRELFRDTKGCYDAIEEILSAYSKNVEKTFEIKLNLDLSFMQLGNN